MSKKHKPYEGNSMSEQENRSRLQLNREPDRVAHEVNTRSRPSIYELPDYDGMDFSRNTRALNLIAPLPRVDPKWGKMRQYWADKTLDNGRRVHDLMQKGYRVRDPKTVETDFSFATEQWLGNDVIQVANRHILMEIPESIYHRIEEGKRKANRQRMVDIGRKHGAIYRDGELSDEKLRVDPFVQDVVVNRGEYGDGGDINFAD